MSARRLALAILVLASHGWPAPSPAQVSLDGSLGASGPVAPGTLPDGTTTDYLIREDMGRRSDGNVFHSFSEFGIPAGRSATFTGEPAANVIARVTGGTPSFINGTLRSLVEGADLWLLNPVGVLFGGTARIDVPGSLHVTSADELRMADGLRFEAIATPPDVLSAAPPEAFGFLGEGAGPISFDRVQNLRVPDGETLSAVGGDVAVTGSVGSPTLVARGGRVQLASASSAVAVPVDVAGLDAGAQEPAALGRVALSSGARVDVSGGASGGRVVIRGGRLALDQARVLGADAPSPDGDAPAIDLQAAETIDVSNRSVVSTTAGNAAPGGDLRLEAPVVVVTGGSTVGSAAAGSQPGGGVHVRAGELRVEDAGGLRTETSGSGAGGDVEIDATSIHVGKSAESPTPGLVGTLARGAGAGGDVRIRAGSLSLEEGAQLAAATNAAGAGGSVEVEASDRVRIVGTSTLGPSAIVASSGLGAGSLASGSGGTVRVAAQTVEIADGGQISARSFGAGDAGSVEVRADERLTVAGGPRGFSVISANTVDGAGGTLEVETDRLELRDGGSVRASTIGAGDSGDVSVRANQIEVAGVDPLAGNEAGVFSEASALPDVLDGGDGGDVDVHVGERLEIGAGGRFSVGSRGFGASGNLRIHGPGDVALAGGATIGAVAEADGRAGDVEIAGVGTLEVTDGAALSARGAGAGGAGSVRVQATRGVLVASGGSITAESTGSGDAGRIAVDAGASLLAQGGSITTEASQASGGQIEIRATSQVVLAESRVTSSVAQGGGDGGDISIDPEFVVLRNSEIRANAQDGNGGNIQIRAGTFLSDATSVVDASSQLGIDGQVQIESPETTLVADLAALPSTFLDAASLLRGSCAARGAGAGSFVVRGRDAIPPAPDTALRAFYAGGSALAGPAAHVGAAR
jgi:filamentous hemagglutinin family protein